MGLVMAGRPAQLTREHGRLERLLTPTELSRATALARSVDRASFVAGHGLARVCAAQLLGVAADRLTLVQRCPTCGGPHGRPWLAEAPELTVSLSHTLDYVACAAAYGPVGVDVERVGDDPLDWGVVAMALTGPEQQELRELAEPRRGFVRSWVRKESLVKVGACDLDTLTSVAVPARTGSTTVAGRRWHFTDWTAADDQVLGAVVTTLDPVGLPAGCVPAALS